MKTHLKPGRWEHEPWTVIRSFLHDGYDKVRYYAFNTQTGERKPLRDDYDSALADIPKLPYARPWGC